MSLRSPLGRVLGSGSAKEGTDHWWMQRVTAVALAVLGTICLLSFAGLDGYEHGAVVAWIARPGVSLALLLFAAVLAYHSSLGLQVVIEDYVHTPFLKVSALVMNKFVHAVAATAAAIAVLKIAFGTA